MGPAGELMLAVAAWIAEQERLVIRSHATTPRFQDRLNTSRNNPDFKKGTIPANSPNLNRLSPHQHNHLQISLDVFSQPE
jgi:hypothetical protein